MFKRAGFYFFTAAIFFFAVPVMANYRTDGYTNLQPPVVSAQENFSKLDSNGDGQVEKDEGPLGLEWLPGRFEMMDLNSDGFLSYDEYVSWSDSPRVQQLADDLSTETFSALDTDRSISLDRDEWVGTKKGFKRWDKNNNGRIEFAETQSR